MSAERLERLGLDPIDRLLVERGNDLFVMLKRGDDVKEVQSSVADWFRDLDPDCKAVAYAAQLVRMVRKMIRDGTSVQQYVTLNVSNTTNNYYAAPPSQASTPKPKAKPAPAPVVVTTLNFRLIADDSLTLTDRVVFSFAWKWAYANHKRKEKKKPARPLTVRRFRKVTGFRAATVTASLAKLKQRGYLTDQLSPKNVTENKRLLGYRKLAWIKSDKGMGFDLFSAFMAQTTKRVNATYVTKALGVSRRTYYNWKKVVTDCTDGGYGLHS